MDNTLYQILKIDNFLELQQELSTAIEGMFQNKECAINDPAPSWFEQHCPKTYKFLLSRSKVPIRYLRFYCTPGGELLTPHVDGHVNFRAPFGLNIPVTGTQNTLMKWYKTDSENLYDHKAWHDGNPLIACLPKVFEGLEKIDELELLDPHFVRTDIIHSVFNPNTDLRVILSVRWYFTKDKYHHWGDVFKL